MDVFTPEGVGTLYFIAGLALGVLSGIATFFGLWVWAARRYDFPGFLLGWIASGVAGLAIGYLMIPLWLPALVGWIWVASRKRSTRAYGAS